MKNWGKEILKGFCGANSVSASLPVLLNPLQVPQKPFAINGVTLIGKRFQRCMDF